MTDEEIDVPESVKFYFSKWENCQAIQQLLSQKDPPKDFDWDNLSHFYNAWLSAKKTQYDYWEFLLDIHNKTWGLVSNYLIDDFDYPQNSWYEGERSLDFVWEYGYLYKGFFHKESEDQIVFGVYVYFDDNYDIRIDLWFWCWQAPAYQEDGEGNYLTDFQGLGHHWAPEVYDQTRYTRNVHSPPLPDKLSVDKLAAAAESAAQAIHRVFTSR